MVRAWARPAPPPVILATRKSTRKPGHDGNELGTYGNPSVLSNATAIAICAEKTRVGTGVSTAPGGRLGTGGERHLQRATGPSWRARETRAVTPCRRDGESFDLQLHEALSRKADHLP